MNYIIQVQVSQSSQNLLANFHFVMPRQEEISVTQYSKYIYFYKFHHETIPKLWVVTIPKVMHNIRMRRYTPFDVSL